MKIAFMLYDSPNSISGPTINARRLLPELNKRGNEVHVMIFFHGSLASTADYFKSQGIRCHMVPRPNFTESQITWILKKIQVINPDIFFANNVVSGWYAGKWIQKAGIPTVVAHRSNDPYYWGMIEEFVFGLPEWSVDGLICVDDKSREKIESLQPKRTRLCFIPSGVPIPKQSSCQKGSFKIAYVGRIVQEQKRIKETLEALIKVVHDFPDISVTFFGEGEERFNLEQRVEEAGLSQKICFIGAIEAEELHKHLLNYNVLVLLSDYEGTPGAVMDGMACGLVPVCTDIAGGVKDLVIPDYTGFLVSDRTASFQEAIRILYDHPKLRIELAKNARAHIINKYSLDIAVERWELFLQSLLESSRSSLPLEIPKKIKLPPTRKEYAFNDIRRLSKQKRIMQKLKRLGHKIKNLLSNLFL